MKRPTLLVIIGPTAVGKTELSIRLAKSLNTEIISADSRQFYKDIAIGTAKPSVEEMAGVPHHFVDFLPLDKEYSAGQFEREVLLLLDDLFKKKDTVIMCGGSGLFVRAVTQGLDNVPHDPQTRETLNREFKESGISPLQEELLAADPKAYDRIDTQNPQRLIRALEVCRFTKQPYSNFLNHTPTQRPFDIVTIGLRREREELYQRIESRTDIMMQCGWMEECRSVSHQRHHNSLNTVGYKEIFQHFDGDISVDECVRLIKQRTRNLAKRQMTFFRGMTDVKWVDLPNDKAVEDILQYI